MKNYYKNKSGYICWFDDKCFLSKQNIDQLEDEGYDLTGWDMLETPTLNYDVSLHFEHKDDKNRGRLVLAKRIFDFR